MNKDIKPVISVIMPVYNCGLYVAEALISILNQSFSDFELIIIDDNSTDNTKELIRAFSDKRIKLIEKAVNTGYTESINLGISLSQGELIARMDGDDISMQTRFEKQVAFLYDNPNVAICGTWFKLSSNNKTIEHPLDHNAIKLALLTYNPIGHPTVMIRSSFLKDHNLTFDIKTEPAEDYDLWSQAVHLGKLANIPEPLLYYRIHGGQVSNSKLILQNKNSDLIKKRMFLSLLDNVTENDKLNYNLFKREQKLSAETIKNLVKWLDKIILLNKTKACFMEPEFTEFIKKNVKVAVREYFINQAALNGNTAYTYISLNNKLNEHFTHYELIKLFTKCIISEKACSNIKMILSTINKRLLQLTK